VIPAHTALSCSIRDFSAEKDGGKLLAYRLKRNNDGSSNSTDTNLGWEDIDEEFAFDVCNDCE
jgi:hypothetical protein